MRNRNKIEERYGEKNPKIEMTVLFGDGATNLSEVEVSEMEIRNAYLVNCQDMDTGEEKKVLYLVNMDNKIYATISSTFVDNFLSMAEWCADEGYTLRKISVETSKSKKGREFLKCSPLVILDKEGKEV